MSPDSSSRDATSGDVTREAALGTMAARAAGDGTTPDPDVAVVGRDRAGAEEDAGPDPREDGDRRAERRAIPADGDDAVGAGDDGADPDADATDDADTGDDQRSWPPIRRLGAEGRYHLEEPIAAGGAATVWRAFDTHLERSVALKILHPHLVADADTVRRFERESRNAARLHHPNATRIYDSGRVNDVVYLVMEYVDGPTLKDLMNEHGAFENPRHVAAVGLQVAAALQEAHSQGLIHRDIKPANILFTTDGVVKVADFGIAKALSSTVTDLTAEGSTVGTATYIAPEQYMGTRVDARADVYALGMVLYECLTGRPAFLGDTPTATAAARLTREVLPPRTVRADVDRRLDDVVVRATRRDVHDRYEDVGEVTTALQAVLRGRDPQELTEDLLEAEPPEAPAIADMPEVDPDAATDPNLRVPSRRRVPMPAALAFLAGVLVTAVVVLLSRGGDEPAPVPDAGTVEIVTGSDFDPYGDQVENSEQVPLAFDGNPTTAWDTETYQAPADRPFNDRKSGVGLYVELEEMTMIDGLDLLTGEPGLSFDLYVSETLPDAIDELLGWRQPVRSFSAVGTNRNILLPEPVRGRYVLLWFTELPQVEADQQRGRVLELQVRGEPAPEDDATS